MDGGRGEDGEQIEPQGEIAETAEEGREEQDAKSGSMVERIPRYVSGSGTGEGSSVLTATRSEGRESDIAMAVKMVKAVEEDATAVAGSLATLFSSLQSALSEVTGSSIEHMRCHSEAAGLLQDASIDAATKGQRFINACLRLNEEMKRMGSLAAQLKTLRQAHFGIHGSLGGRLFDLITQKRENKSLYYEDLVIAKGLYEKGSSDEAESFMYQLVDLTGDGHVQRTEVEGVVLSILQTVLGSKDAVPDASLPEGSLQAFLEAASFTEDVEGEGAPCMSREDFRKWCASVPSMKKFLTTLLKGRVAGLAGRQVPELLMSEKMGQFKSIVRKEHAWHLAGAMQAQEAVQWVLVYQSSAHGLSFNTFLGKLAIVQGPSVLVVKDKEGCVFGGYASQPWEKHSEYYGDMKSFLFTLHPKAAVYRPTGKNANLQWCAVNYSSESLPNGVGFGGQIHHFGLFINGAFEGGHTRNSVTFNNPPLSCNPNLQPDVIECWAVVVKGEDSTSNGAGGLQGTILERFKEDRQMLNMVGIAGASVN